MTLRKVCADDARARGAGGDLSMGQPDVVEHAGVPFTRYASRECSGLCAQRWWYENRLGMDTEAWSVELDASDRVLTTSRLTSP
ncbi:hypothetical protein C7E18_14765 [Stenotrophomonas maltophilia]|nr:hypothetical protein C7E18_14765 [Stenotrophomonas maltophilia]